MTVPFHEVKARLMANPRVKAEYGALALEFEISAELVEGRGCEPVFLSPNWPLEWAPASPPSPDWKAGQTLPSMKTLLRFAEATGSKFHVRLSAA